jgi:Ca2+-binding EF-hand superfamily protein
MSEEDVKKMVGAADVSGDGTVNYEEFVKILVSDVKAIRTSKREGKANQ